ncbi:MAG: hypothetical protein HQ567_19035 [Candidatus Nealsonbacteria bacterium]|nr:hypothetical protein [Candidatus Nealsonbacteria bacterium]
MSSFASDPQDADGAPQSVPAEAGSPGGQPYDRALLERVLQETLTDESARESLSGVDRAALLGVAARYRNQPLSLDPIVIALIEAMVQTHFGILSDVAEFWRPITAQIGRTLWDDPVARARLEVFWHRLCEVEP